MALSKQDALLIRSIVREEVGEVESRLTKRIDQLEGDMTKAIVKEIMPMMDDQGRRLLKVEKKLRLSQPN